MGWRSVGACALKRQLTAAERRAFRILQQGHDWLTQATEIVVGSDRQDLPESTD